MKSISFIFTLMICATACCQSTAPVAPQPLTLETVANGFWKPHRPFVLRLYSAPDGTKGEVKYVTFKSRIEAKQYVQKCLKPEAKIIYKKQEKAPDGQINGERIVAVTPNKEYALIKGVGLNYFFIDSASLGTAIQIEQEETAP